MSTKHKILAGVVTLICVVSVASPRAAHAQLIVSDPTNLVPNTLTSVTAGKNLLNPIFYKIAQQSIQAMQKSTVNWINSGFQGSPGYAADIQNTLTDAADQQAEKFVKQIRSQLSVNSPFRDKVAQNLLGTYYLSTSRDGFFIQNPYTLNKVATDDRAFLSGDFSKGGFQAWFSATLNQQNNPIGAANLAKNELQKRIDSIQGQVHEELGWGNGVFSWRKCDVQGPQLADGGSTESVPILDANGKPTGQTQPVVGVTKLKAQNTCFESHIETPGSVIAGQLNHTLGLGADSLVQAKEFDEIVNALVGQLMQHVMGDTGLLGLSQPSTASGGRAYFNQTTTSTTPSAGVTVISSFLHILDGQSTDLQTYLTNWQRLNAAALAAKTALQQSSCVPNADTIIATQVQPVITQAATVIGNIPNQLNAIDQIRSQTLGSVSLSASQQTTVLQQANANYQVLLSSNSLPSVSDFSYATQQSQDSGTSQPPSLLTQMNQLTAQARCGT